MRSAALLLLLGALTACDSAASQDVPDAASVSDAAAATDTVTVMDTAADSASVSDSGADTVLPRLFTVVTFNTGTTEAMGDDDGPYTTALSTNSDLYYGDGLAWQPAVAAAQAFFAEVDPDIVVFQEIFYSGVCPEVPEEARTAFICETWEEGDPTVAQVILGDGWQVMCHPGKDDKCAAVNRRFGSFRGCEADFCLEGLDGTRVEDCGRGARVGRGLIDLVDGGTLTLVNVHGSSGMTEEEFDCRTKQFEQVFVDLGDGEPGANGDRNLIMGDFNTDPGRLTAADPSAARLLDFVGEGLAFHFVSDVGRDVPASYAGLFNIDHVISDVLQGNCWTAGLSADHPAVLETPYFDHKPVVCTIE